MTQGPNTSARLVRAYYWLLRHFQENPENPLADGIAAFRRTVPEDKLTSEQILRAATEAKHRSEKEKNS